MNQMGRKNILTDYHTTTLPDSCADFVVFNETYGYGNPNILMKESARILKPNGTMVLKDFIYGKGFDQKKEHKGWDYFVYPLSKVLLLAEQSGLKVSWLFKPTVFYSRFVTFFAESRMKEWHQKVDFDVETVLIKFEKVGHG